MISGDGSCATATGDTGSCVLNSPVPSSGSTVGRPARVARDTDSKRGPGSISARSASANRTRLFGALGPGIVSQAVGMVCRALSEPEDEYA